MLAPAGRAASGYRLYDESVVERLELVRKSQSVGFSLEEIAWLIREAEAGRQPCEDVRRLAARKLASLDERIAELTRYRAELRETLDAWERKGAADGHICGLIEGLQGDRLRAPRNNGRQTETV